MTPFCKAVVEILKATPHSSMSACPLRKALMAQGWGKHPAAVAMNLTKMAWKGEYITCYIRNERERVFMLTSEGKE
jgi:hypothetical protein